MKASVATDAENEAIVIVSQYDEKGRMVEAKTEKITVNAKATLLSVPKNAEAVTYRAFMWNSLTGMKPIVPMTEIK